MVTCKCCLAQAEGQEYTGQHKLESPGCLMWKILFKSPSHPWGHGRDRLLSVLVKACAKASSKAVLKRMLKAKAGPKPQEATSWSNDSYKTLNTLPQPLVNENTHPLQRQLRHGCLTTLSVCSLVCVEEILFHVGRHVKNLLQVSNVRTCPIPGHNQVSWSPTCR